MNQPARINRKQKALVCLGVGLLVFLFVRSLYVQFGTQPADPIVAFANAGIGLLNVIFSPMFLVMVVPLFGIFWILVKTPEGPKPDSEDARGTDKMPHP